MNEPLQAPSVRYRYYVVAVIWLVLLLRFVDFQVLAVLMESIRSEFHFSDTQLGLLGGIAFSLFYGVLGLPIAWLADRANRRNIIAAAVGLWSLMTVLCGMAGGFVSLFLARIGVGVGEAGGQAPAAALVSDYVPERQRSTVFALLNTSVPLGVFCGFLVGGWVNDLLGWRYAFYIVGAPGIVVAAVVWLTVREVPRGFADGARTAGEVPPGFRDTLDYLRRRRSYWHLVAATVLVTLAAYGSGLWFPSFFMRIHGMSASEIGTWAAFVYGIGGVSGSLLGGVLADRLAQKSGDRRWLVWLPALATVSILPFALFVFLWPNPVQALLVHVATTTLMHMYMGPAYGTVQTLAGPRRRALAAAINYFFINLVALGLGPLLIGMISDLLGDAYGGDALRYAIIGVMVTGYGWAALHFFWAGKCLREDLSRATSAPAAA